MKEILLTAAVVTLVYFVVRKRNAAMVRQKQPTSPVRPIVDPLRSKAIRRGVYLFFALMLAATAIFIYLEWREDYQVIDVRVVNSRTGKEVVYQAHRGDVDARSFVTIDGRRISVADVERIEMGGH